jgi:steroid 5-alpha reductase family enzyme
MENIKRLVYLIVYILVFGGFTAYNWEAMKNGLASIPFFWIIVIEIFLIQVAAYIPAAIFQTEQFYDLTGSLTNLFATATATFFNPFDTTATKILGALLVAIWAFRLGGYLFTRILK